MSLSGRDCASQLCAAVDVVLARRRYDIRKRFHRVYYHFRPERHYWVLVILGRKFLIAFTSLMFNKNPAFQLSVALLVMFAACALLAVRVAAALASTPRAPRCVPDRAMSTACCCCFRRASSEAPAVHEPE